MHNFKKLITFNNIVLLALLIFGGYFFFLSQKKVTPIVIPVSNLSQPISLDRFMSFLAEKTKITDPSSGNSGDINLAVRKTKGSIELSWPVEYQPYSLILKNLGKTNKIDDNQVLLAFTTDKAQNRYFPKAGPVVVEREKIGPPLKINSSFAGAWQSLSPLPIPTNAPLEFKDGEKYSVEIIFEKEGEDKIYTSLLAFNF